MRNSCNGCRVLRKGCSESCSIRPCLQWIKNPEAQAHATIFLAKFYGRAGLINLINSGPTHLRPEIFRSLLYEACARIVNPIHGSVGLLWSGNWPMVQAAVDAVLKGAPIVSISSDSAAAGSGPQPTYGIRHVYKTGLDTELRKVSKATRTRFKRTAKSKKPETDHEHSNRSSEPDCRGAGREESVGTHEAASHVSQCEPSPAVECEDLPLDLTLGLGLEPAKRDAGRVLDKASRHWDSTSGDSTGACSFGVELQLCA
ncbi:LOB domain-containing protein 41-like protein [Carex littledalei]|uniref:LOB domain-containing protein 41-like protein n=1 Tax=Carex littledalei TaxID=544730 RepID=A0A833RHM2_9POAL|nr:LOB domain-containing protein 41-like protein [Carex littledalei]